MTQKEQDKNAEDKKDLLVKNDIMKLELKKLKEKLENEVDKV